MLEVQASCLDRVVDGLLPVRVSKRYKSGSE